MEHTNVIRIDGRPYQVDPDGTMFPVTEEVARRIIELSAIVEGSFGSPTNGEAAPPIALRERFDRALAFASELHRDHARKGTTIPYLAHLMGVTALVLEDGANEDEAIAALLHDAVEDRGGRETLEVIRREFGDEVAGIVEGCTDTDVSPKPPWRTRKERYLAHLRSAPRSVVRVSLADKLHNARALTSDLGTHGEELWRRFNPESDQLWYYRSLARIFRDLDAGPMAARLEREVVELETLAIVSALKHLVAYGDRGDYAGHHVVIHDQSTGYYIQFAVDRGGLFCEAVHNKYLDDDHQLTSDQVEELLAIGWNDPSYPGQNFYCIFQPASDEDYRHIVGLVRGAFESVYRIPSTRRPVLVTSWSRRPLGQD
jgi:GTP pyrophosphokinase